MTSSRKLNLILPVAGAVLLAVYVGAYYWLVDVDTAGIFSGTWEPRPTYAFPGDQIESPSSNPLEVEFQVLFAPAHWLDCRIRPHVWEH